MLRWPVCALLAYFLGCSESLTCTAAGCLDGFSIDLTQPLPSGADTIAPLPAGAYEIELTLDDERITCHRSIPQGPAVDCKPSDSVIVSGIQPMRFPEGALAGFDVEIRQTPRVVTAIVRHDGAVLAQGTFSPEYREVAPNGKECGPVCNSAPSATLALTF